MDVPERRLGTAGQTKSAFESGKDDYQEQPLRIGFMFVALVLFTILVESVLHHLNHTLLEDGERLSRDRVQRNHDPRPYQPRAILRPGRAHPAGRGRGGARRLPLPARRRLPHSHHVHRGHGLPLARDQELEPPVQRARALRGHHGRGRASRRRRRDAVRSHPEDEGTARSRRGAQAGRVQGVGAESTVPGAAVEPAPAPARDSLEPHRRVPHAAHRVPAAVHGGPGAQGARHERLPPARASSESAFAREVLHAAHIGRTSWATLAGFVAINMARIAATRDRLPDGEAVGTPTYAPSSYPGAGALSGTRLLAGGDAEDDDGGSSFEDSDLNVEIAYWTVVLYLLLLLLAATLREVRSVYRVFKHQSQEDFKSASVLESFGECEAAAKARLRGALRMQAQQDDFLASQYPKFCNRHHAYLALIKTVTLAYCWGSCSTAWSSASTSSSPAALGYSSWCPSSWRCRRWRPFRTSFRRWCSSPACSSLPRTSRTTGRPSKRSSRRPTPAMTRASGRRSAGSGGRGGPEDRILATRRRGAEAARRQLPCIGTAASRAAAKAVRARKLAQSDNDADDEEPDGSASSAPLLSGGKRIGSASRSEAKGDAPQLGASNAAALMLYKAEEDLINAFNRYVSAIGRQRRTELRGAASSAPRWSSGAADTRRVPLPRHRSLASVNSRGPRGPPRTAAASPAASSANSEALYDTDASPKQRQRQAQLKHSASVPEAASLADPEAQMARVKSDGDMSPTSRFSLAKIYDMRPPPSGRNGGALRTDGHDAQARIGEADAPVVGGQHAGPQHVGAPPAPHVAVDRRRRLPGSAGQRDGIAADGRAR